MKFPKPGVVHDQDYLEWIERRPCVVCGRLKAGFKQDKNDAHHVNDKSGGSAKFNDKRALPMCWDHHREGHQIGWITFQKKHNLDFEILIEAFNIIYERSNLP